MIELEGSFKQIREAEDIRVKAIATAAYSISIVKREAIHKSEQARFNNFAETKQKLLKEVEKYINIVKWAGANIDQASWWIKNAHLADNKEVSLASWEYAINDPVFIGRELFEYFDERDELLKRVLTSYEAASLWGLQENTIIKACQQGRLVSRKSGKVLLITLESMEKTYGSRSQEPTV